MLPSLLSESLRCVFKDKKRNNNKKPCQPYVDGRNVPEPDIIPAQFVCLSVVMMLMGVVKGKRHTH